MTGTGDPIDAICGTTKVERRQKDGTTVIFYSFPNEEKTHALQMAADITERKQYPFRDFEKYPVDYVPSNDAVRNGFQEAVRQAQGIADVKYYDLDHLTPDLRIALENNGITIPTQPDLAIVRDRSAAFSNANGQSDLPNAPKEANKDGPGVLKINYGYSEDPTKSKDLLATILHENGHGLGLRHSFAESVKGNPLLDKPEALDPLHDTRGNTVMSYNRYDNYGMNYNPQTYQELDVKALQEKYGVSKHPTPDLLQNLAREEQQQAAAATTDLPTWLAKDAFEQKTLEHYSRYQGDKFEKLEDAAADGVFDAKDYREYKARDAKDKATFSKEELVILHDHGLEFKGLSVEPLVKQKNGETVGVINIEINKDKEIGYREIAPMPFDVQVITITPDAMKAMQKDGSLDKNGILHVGGTAPHPVDAPHPTPAPAQKSGPTAAANPFSHIDLGKYGNIHFDGANTMQDVAAKEVTTVASKQVMTTPELASAKSAGVTV